MRSSVVELVRFEKGSAPSVGQCCKPLRFGDLGLGQKRNVFGQQVLRQAVLHRCERDRSNDSARTTPLRPSWKLS